MPIVRDTRFAVRQPRQRDRLKPWLLVVLPALGSIAIWEAAVRWRLAPEFLLPAPSSVLKACLEHRDYIAASALLTFSEVAAGLAGALLLGLAVAVPLGLWRDTKHMVLPVLGAVQALPLIAIAPLIVFWLGTGFATKALLAGLLAFIPISLRLSQGLWSLDEGTEQFLYLVSRSRWKVFVHGRLPAALPSLLDSLRLAVPAALVGALVGEYIGSDGGLGFALLASLGQLDLPLAFALLLTVSLLSVLTHPLVSLSERVLLPWLPAETP